MYFRITSYNVCYTKLLRKPYKYFGAIWGGIAITSITYFLLIKGAKDVTFMSKETQNYIKENSTQIIWLSFAFWTIFSQLLKWMFKVNILKVVVLAGTFALAMAFAGNDLVNFIGIPLAGYEAFNQSGGSVITSYSIHYTKLYEIER